MKVLTFTTLFPNKEMPNYAIFVKERILHLAKLCDVRVVAPVPYFPKFIVNKKWSKFSRIPMKEEIDGIKIYHPRYFIIPKLFRSMYSIFMYISLKGFIKKLNKEFNFDIIDGHFIYPDGLAGVLLAKKFDKKVVLTARGTDINWYPKFGIIRSLIRYTLKNANRIISVNNDLKDKMAALGADAGKIEVIPNGVAFDKFYPEDRIGARERLGLNRDRAMLLSVGNLIESKGFQFLIEALSLMRENIDLYIIGEGPYRKALNDVVEKSGLKKRVKFVGEIPHAELRKWYSAADLFCLTSLREGRPNVVLESLACGRPVITMNKWGLSDLVKDDMGILADSYEPSTIAQKIERALRIDWDAGLISRNMSALSWGKTADSLLALYNKVFTEQDIIFFSSDDWNSGLKTSKYHLATRLARNNRVFFINSIGLRTPSASTRDAKRIFAKLSGFFKGVVKVRENLFVYTPIAIPFQGIGFVRFLNNSIIMSQIKMIMAKFGVRYPLVWTFLPNSFGVVRRISKRALIYYCVDDMSAFKNVPAYVIHKLDEELTKKADMVFAVSKELFEKKRLLNKNTFYSPHGVDFELFNKAVTENPAEKPVEIPDIPKPIIGFYGLISSDWIDYGLVKFISDKRPDWSFVFVGKIDRIKDSPPEAKNIYYIPVKPYEELYRYSRLFDAAILPFNVNKLTIHSHPLKILEYLAAGKPVVSIKIPEILKYEDVIEIAEDREDFLNKIEKCLKNNSQESIGKRVKLASQNSWEKRFDEIHNIIDCHS